MANNVGKYLPYYVYFFQLDPSVRKSGPHYNGKRNKGENKIVHRRCIVNKEVERSPPILFDVYY